MPKTTLKKEASRKARGSILDHFEELFGRLFATKNGPGPTSDRFFGEMRDSVSTLVITIHSKGSHGPELTKKRLRERFWVTENGGETGAQKKLPKTVFGNHFGQFWLPFWLHFGSKIEKNDAEKNIEKKIPK